MSDIPRENIVAMKAVAQWKLGHREWGSTFANLATADDPKVFAKSGRALSELGDKERRFVEDQESVEEWIRKEARLRQQARQNALLAEAVEVLREAQEISDGKTFIGWQRNRAKPLLDKLGQR